MHLVENMEGLVASPSVIDKDLSRGLLRAGHDGNGISGIVDPLTLAWMITLKDNERKLLSAPSLQHKVSQHKELLLTQVSTC